MTDLERARLLLYRHTDIGDVVLGADERVAKALAAARRQGAEAALRAALPAEPTAEAIAVMTAAAAAGWPRHEFRDAYRALRAHLLGEDA